MVQLSAFDLFLKTKEASRIRTNTGGIVFVLSGILLVLLFISELSSFLSVQIHSTLNVDPGGEDKLPINLEVVFPTLPCAFLSIDAQDVSGESQIGIEDKLYKKRLSSTGEELTEEDVVRIKQILENKKNSKEKMVVPKNSNACESCYGAENHHHRCCPTCESVRDAYRFKGWAFTSAVSIAQCVNEGFLDELDSQRGEGCLVHGNLQVQKVAGNIHVAPGKSYENHHAHVHDFQVLSDAKGFNMSHIIKKLSFGEDIPGVIHPLNGVEKHSVDKSGLYQYYIKVVPTTYNSLSGDVIDSNQYSVTDHFKPLDASGGHSHGPATDGHGLPGVYFYYDFSPIHVNYFERKMSFGEFIIGICAIIGGVFTVATFIDSFIYRGASLKNSIGKAH